jgi:hypothetical protein
LAGTQDLADLFEGRVAGAGVGGFAHGVEPRRGARILAANTPGARINLTRARPPGSLTAAWDPAACLSAIFPPRFDFFMLWEFWRQP